MAYLIGVGTATNRTRDAADRQARDRAIADISGQLETHIRSTVTTYVDENIKMEGGKTSSEMLSDVSSSVEAVTSASLTAIRPVAQYYDEKAQFGAALVAIKRTDFARQAADELSELDGKITSLMTEASQLTDAGKQFQSLRRYAVVEQLLVKRAAVAAQSSFVMPAQRLAEAPTELSDVYAVRRKAASQVQLVLMCKHDAFGKPGATAPIEQLVVPEFADLGVVVKPARAIDNKLTDDDWDNVDALIAAFSGLEGQPLLMMFDVTTTSSPAGHADMIGVRSRGTARLFGVKSGELLMTVSYSPDADGDSPAIGKPERRDVLVHQALAQLAAQLSARVMESL